MNYENLIHLDAEDLAEGGIRRAYTTLEASLRQLGVTPDEIEEFLDDSEPSYRVRHRGVDYPIYGGGLPDDMGESWGRAAHALFTIVNTQLGARDVKFYAINGGNDLSGMFLTASEMQAARKELPNKSDWPYLPINEAPSFGMFW